MTQYRRGERWCGNRVSKGERGRCTTRLGVRGSSTEVLVDRSSSHHFLNFHLYDLLPIYYSKEFKNYYNNNQYNSQINIIFNKEQLHSKNNIKSFKTKLYENGNPKNVNAISKINTLTEEKSAIQKKK